MSASRRSEPVSTTEAVKPEPDDPRKPDEVADITTPSWRHVLRKTFREFSADGCTDQAAALTYYGVMSMLPAAIALLSLVSLFGQGQATVDTLLGIARDVVPTTVVDAIEPPLQRLASSPHGGWALVLGLAGALWSASGYVGAFGRTLNRIYDVGEGRPIWKLRPAMLVVTAVALTLVAAAALMIVVSGALAESIGEELGFGDAAVTAWSVAKWPVVVAVVALLYWATPNVRQPRWVRPGSGYGWVRPRSAVSGLAAGARPHWGSGFRPQDPGARPCSGGV